MDAKSSDRPAGQFALTVLVAVAVGGAVGALGRYGLEQLNPSRVAGFPVGTFIANISGAFGLGLLLAALDRVRAPRVVKPLVGTGFFGAFTTFSTFALEIVMQIQDGHVAMAVTYALITIVVGLALAAAGHQLGRHVPHQRAALS